MAYSFLEPIRVGKMVLKNRIIVPAMARYLCEDGFATEDYIRYYEAMAKGGVAMVTVGIMPIDLGWPSTMTSQPCLGDDKYIPQLQKAVTAMHAAGAKVSFQPWMPGRAPYTYADAVERAQDIAIVNKLTKDEILNIERKYVAACLRCAACGVDAIEWHNAHNYLGEQFFSPYFNHRTDEYGAQNVENAMRFSVEVIDRIKDIRTAERSFKTKYNRFTGDFDTLINFVLTDSLEFERKIVDEDDSLAMAQLKKSGRKNSEKVWVHVIDTIFTPKKLTAEQVRNLRYVPGTNNQTEFELEAGLVTTESKVVIPVVECHIPYKMFLDTVRFRQEVINLVDDQENNFSNYGGIKFGSMEKGNNEAGNWGDE